MAGKKVYKMLQRKKSEMVNGKWKDSISHEKVRVLAEAEGYAMVRFPQCYPFVWAVKDLYDYDKEAE